MRRRKRIAAELDAAVAAGPERAQAAWSRLDGADREVWVRWYGFGLTRRARTKQAGLVVSMLADMPDPPADEPTSASRPADAPATIAKHIAGEAVFEVLNPFNWLH